MATELGTAYVSIVAETSKLEAQLKQALEGGGKNADIVGKDIGKRISASASKAMRDGWRPDQDIMAGIPDTKAAQIGARIGQIIGKGVVAGMHAREAGVQFGHSFAEGAGSVGLGRVVSGWKSELSGNGIIGSAGMLAGKAFSAAFTLAAGGAVAGIGLALTKGFQRLESLDTATQKLNQMNEAAKRVGKPLMDVKGIVKDVTDSVTGTPYSLDSAFSTAVMAIGAGTKDIKRFMTDVTDAAGFAGTDLDRMGTIFTQVLAKGKLQGDEMMQLMEAGLPAKSWIEESFHLTSDQFDKMQQKGEITMDMLQKSIEDHAGGMAKAAGDTLKGAIDNMETSIARVGADFLAAIFGGPDGDPAAGMKDSIKRITDMLNNLDGWIKAHSGEIRDFFLKAKDAAGKLVESVGKIIEIVDKIPGGVQGVVYAFAAWNAIKFTGLLSALGEKGGGGVLGKLGLILAAIDVINRFTHNNSNNSSGESNEINAGPNFGQQGLDAATGAWLGSKFGPGGAVLGGLLGAAVEPTLDLSRGGVPAKNGVLPGAPNTANLPTVGGIPIPGLQSGGGAQKFAQSGNAAGGVNLDTIPAAVQKYANDCIDASARIILSHSGVNMTEDQLKNVIAPGGSIDSLAGGLNSINPQGNFRAVQGSGGNPAAMLSAIQGSISGGTGSILNIAPGSSLAGRTFADGHYVAVTGFNPDGTINVSDTADGRQYSVSAADAFQASKGRGIVVGTGVGPPPKKYSSGGSVDTVPAMLAPGEHVLTSGDVKAMGGQSSVYSFRNALHMADGGAVTQKKLQDMRTKGAIPAGAGSTAEAGTSGVAQAINMGGDIINGLIDQAASAAATAVSAAATAGSFGAGGQAAGPAASFAIGLGANAAKRGVKYGFQMGGIGADALLQQLTPFGMPRWLTQDYTGFVPQQAIQGALSDVLSGGAQKAAGGQEPGGPGVGSGPAMPGSDKPGGPISNFLGTLSPQNIDPSTTQHGQTGGSPPGAAMFSDSSNSFLSTELAQPEAQTPGVQPMFKVDNIYTTDAHGVGEELSKRGRLAQMQYAGRPMG